MLCDAEAAGTMVPMVLTKECNTVRMISCVFSFFLQEEYCTELLPEIRAYNSYTVFTFQSSV